MSFFEELKRRNVIKVAAAYIIVGWLIMQIGDTLGPALLLPGWINSALAFFLILGFPLAMFFAWAFEMTPEGIKKEKEVDRSQSITKRTGRKLDFLIIGVLVLALGYFVYESRFTPQTGSEPISDTSVSQSVTAKDQQRSLTPIENSIAVLPFANRSNQADDLFFTDGIHDDLLTQLAKIKDLKVISRTSVMEYRDTTKKIPEIAKELNVSKILEGGVQRAGKRIRINAQLIDVATDQHLWAETFDREMTMNNIFDIQSEITRQIVTAVKGELTDVEQQVFTGIPTDNLQAYEAYLHARAATNRADYSREKYIEAQPWAERAVELDPEFAQAWAILSEIHTQAIWIGYDSSPERRQATRDALDHAMALAPDEAAVKAAEADYQYRVENDYPAAYRLYQEARAMAPGDARILLYMAITQRRLGLWQEAIRTFEQSRELDPANVFTATQMVDTLIWMHEWAPVEELVDEWMVRYPQSGDLKAYKVQARMYRAGDLESARAIFDRIIPQDGAPYFNTATWLPRLERDYDAWLAILEIPEIKAFGFQTYAPQQLFQGMAHHFNGNETEARRVLNQYIEELTSLDTSGPIAKGYQNTYIALSYAYLGEYEKALETSRRAMEILPRERDHLFGSSMENNHTLILAMAGHRDEALARLAANIDAPEGYGRWKLYLDPAWDFFRDDERFNELIRPLNLEENEQ